MRYYNSPDGRRLPSVTSVLGATMPVEQRERIERFYLKTGAPLQNAEAIRRGESVDAWAKAFLMRGRLPSIDFKFNGFIRQLTPYLETWREQADEIQVDVQLLSNHYGGTADILLKSNGQWSVIDLKTKNHIFLDAVIEAKLQCLAYGQVLEGQGLELRSIAPLLVTRNESKLFEVTDPGEFQNLRDLWAYRLEQFYRNYCDEEEAAS